MYNPYFGFSEPPFKNNLDRRFFFLSEKHKEVLSALLYFIRERKEFALVCGDVGTGKTMIIHQLLDRLPRSVRSITITYSDIEYKQLIYYLAGKLKIADAGSKNILELINEIKKALIKTKHKGRQTVLIVDEAHLLPARTLDHIRLLSNLETNEEKLIQILLVGQNELSAKLNQPNMRQLRQRININRSLGPLSPAETIEYIDYRLKVVGSDFDACFEAACTSTLFKLTNGIPRLINQICDTALLICQIDKRPKIDLTVLKKADAALRTDSMFASSAGRQRSRRAEEYLRIFCFVVSLVTILASLLFFGYREGYWGSAKEAVPGAPTDTAESPPRPSSEPSGPAVDSGAKLGPGQDQLPPATGPPPTDRQAAAAPAGQRDGLQTPGEALPSSANPQRQVSPAPVELGRVAVKNGDTLGKIAMRWYPDMPEVGMEAIRLANPSVTDTDPLEPGRTLVIPSLDETFRSIQLAGDLYYAPFKFYQSKRASLEALSRLTHSGIRCEVRSATDPSGQTGYQLMLGGYKRAGDLIRAVKDARAKTE